MTVFLCALCASAREKEGGNMGPQESTAQMVDAPFPLDTGWVLNLGMELMKDGITRVQSF